jgi:hypothetical protein
MRVIRWVLGGVAIAVLGCAGGGTAPPADGPASAASPSGDDAPASGDQAAPSPPESDDPGAVIDAPGPSADGPVDPNAIVDLNAWCTEHDVEANLEVERCQLAPLGKKTGDTLWCFRREEIDDTRVLYYQALYTLRAKKLAKVVEIPYAASPKPNSAKDEPSYYVRLSVKIADDKKSFVVADDTSPNCEQAQARVREDLSGNPPAQQPFLQVIGKVCAARGKYGAGGQRLR